MKKLRNIFSIVLAVTLMSIPALVTNGKASADTFATAVLAPVDYSDGCKYVTFNAPNSVFFDGTILVSDGATVKTFDKTGKHLRDQNFQDIVTKGVSANASTVTLINGSITKLPLDGSAASTYVGSYKDICVSNDDIYALSDNSVDRFNIDSDVSLEASYPIAVDAHAFAVANDTVYLAVANAVFPRTDDILAYDIANSTMENQFYQSEKIAQLCADATTLYALTDSGISAYDCSNKLKYNRSLDTRGVCAISAHGGTVITLDNLGALSAITADKTDAITASASSEVGFFNTPSQVAQKNGIIYVSDTVNNRIAIYSVDNASYFYGDDTVTLSRPTAVTVDNYGTIYVGHDYDKISVFSAAERKLIRSHTLSNDVVKELRCNAKNEVYVRGDKAVYKLGETVSTLYDAPVRAIAVKQGASILYALTDNAVLTVTDDATTALYTVSANGKSLAVDKNNSAFVLYETAVKAYRANSTDTYSLSHTVIGDGSLEISLGKGSGFTYGDVFVLDKYAHRLFTADFGCVVTDGNFTPPVVDNDTANTTTTGIIRTALTDVPLYSRPIESNSIYTISQGRKVITVEYDIAESELYSLVLIDNLAENKLMTGYVYKELLSAPLAYSAPPDSRCVIPLDDVSIYKWPSVFSTRVKTAAKYEEYGMLDFVASYRDDYNNLWYKIEVSGGSEGYVLAVNLSLHNFEPVFNRPDYDAVVISVDGSVAAPCYLQKDGEYELLNVSLATDTRVEVIGTFDTSRRFTQIKYFEQDKGTLTCYIETKYLKYTGVNVVMIVSIVVISLTAILLAALLIGYYTRKKREV